MRKTFFMILALLLGLTLCVSGAWADIVFNDNTLVQPWLGNSTTTLFNGGNPIDVIANAGDTNFDISGATFTTAGHLIIQTNWTVGFVDQGAHTADLFVSSGANRWAIRLDPLAPVGPTGLGAVFINPTFQTTQGVFSGFANEIYGGRYTEDGGATFHLIPSLATGGTDGGTVLVNWGTGKVDVDLSTLSGFNANNFSFIWAGATCGNDTIHASVPIPPTALLLGTGLLGLVGLGWRRRKS